MGYPLTDCIGCWGADKGSVFGVSLALPKTIATLGIAVCEGVDE